MQAPQRLQQNAVQRAPGLCTNSALQAVPAASSRSGAACLACRQNTTGIDTHAKSYSDLDWQCLVYTAPGCQAAQAPVLRQ